MCLYHWCRVRPAVRAVFRMGSRESQTFESLSVHRYFCRTMNAECFVCLSCHNDPTAFNKQCSCHLCRSVGGKGAICTQFCAVFWTELTRINYQLSSCLVDVTFSIFTSEISCIHDERMMIARPRLILSVGFAWRNCDFDWYAPAFRWILRRFAAIFRYRFPASNSGI